MAKILIGFTVVLVVGIIGLLLFALFTRIDYVELKPHSDKQKSNLQVQSKVVENLKLENKNIEARLKQTTKEAEQLSARVNELQQELEKANDREALLQAQIEKLTAPAAEKPEQPGETSAEDELAKVQREAIEKYSHILKVGQPLSEEARKELEVDEASEARISELLSNEAARITDALARFCMENIPDPPKDLSDWTSQALLGKIAPEMMQEMSKLGQLTREDHLKIARGEKDLLDYLPRDSQVMKLAYALYKVRRETYRQVERELPPEKMDTFKNKYLPPNDFLFPGNLNMAFGKIDWEKER